MPKQGAQTLGEVMGAKGAEAAKRGLTLADLPKLLGESMPRIQYNPLGRLHLMNALKQRFGANYRNIPGIQGIISEFDREAKTELEHYMIRKRLGKTKAEGGSHGPSK